MPQQEGYIRWPSDAKIPLTLTLVDSSGLGVIGAAPEVSIRRHRETRGGPLDNYFWTGSTFISAATWLPLLEVDPVNNPGLYEYLFEQDLIGLEQVYLIHFRNTAPPVGMAVEEHIVTNEIYIPKTQPEPVTIGPQSIMGQLELVKGLLHHNAMLDNQTYVGGQLSSARLRVFDTAAHVPTTPGGSETLGLLAQFAIESAYDISGLNNKFTLKRVLP